MGMYTAFHFASEIKKDTPKEVVEVLKAMTDGIIKEMAAPDHPFFRTSRWRCLFTMDSYYFDADTHATFRYDDIANAYFLTVTSNIKNYDNEIGLFMEWIDPYLEKFPGDFLGYSRYEETEEPTLLYKK